MSDTNESMNQEAITRTEDVAYILFHAYHQYACVGDEALHPLVEARNQYETVLTKQAKLREDVEQGGGTTYLAREQQERSDYLLSVVSPERFKQTASVVDFFLVGNFVGGLVSRVIPNGDYLPWLYATLKFADRKEAYRRDFFGGILDEYRFESKNSNLGFVEKVKAQIDEEVAYIEEIVKPELEARRRRLLGKTLIVGTVISTLKAKGIMA